MISRSLRVFAVVFLWALWAAAQDPASAPTQPQSQLPDTPSTAKHNEKKSEEQREIEHKEQSDKMFGVVPHYNVTSAKTAQPLTSSEKFKLFARSTFSPFEFFAVGFQAGLSQATDQFPEYGQGAEGYGKRYGAAFADQVSSGFFSNYAYPVIFREDPRYFRSGEGTYMRRFWYSIGQEFVAHRDHGGVQFNFSNVLGAFTSGAISNAYYPESDRTWSDTMQRSSIALAYGAAGNIAGEFWPDVHDRFFVRHRRFKKKKDAADNPQQPAEQPQK